MVTELEIGVKLQGTPKTHYHHQKVGRGKEGFYQKSRGKEHLQGWYTELTKSNFMWPIKLELKILFKIT
jgi:hypothetical protein